MSIRNLDDLLAEGVSGRRVLVRADLNVPLDKQTGEITDDGRIRAVLPTLGALVQAGAKVVVCSHLGRPKGAPDPQYSLRPVAGRLGELLDAPVHFATDTVGESARTTVDALADGQLALLENLRFNKGETSKDDAERGPSPTSSPRLVRRTWTTRSARCTASTPVSTTYRPGCRTSRAGWCCARWRCCPG